MQINEHYAGQLSTFLDELLHCIQEVELMVPGLELLMQRAPEQIERMIPDLLKFPSMSFIELHYRIPKVRAKPGIRFLLEDTGSGRQIRSILFNDTVFWEVDDNLTKIEQELVTFRLDGKQIEAEPSRSLSKRFGGATAWQKSLRHALEFAIPYSH